MNPIIEHRNPSVSEYQEIRRTTGWDMLDDQAVERSLANSEFSVCIMDGETLIGIGRVIGDGGIYFYVQDIIVHPDHQEKGIGRKIMEEVEKYLSDNAPENAFIGLMSAEGVMPFYEQFGYQRRPEEGQGMYKRFQKR